MTDPFLPRPSPNPHDVFECDSNSHLRGQRVMVNYEDQEGHGGADAEYISTQHPGKKGENPGVLISNYHLSYPRATNPRPKPPCVSCFIRLIDAPPYDRAYSPSFCAILCMITHSLPSERPIT